MNSTFDSTILSSRYGIKNDIWSGIIFMLQTFHVYSLGLLLFFPQLNLFLLFRLLRVELRFTITTIRIDMDDAARRSQCFRVAGEVM